MAMTPTQCRMARAGLKMSNLDLASAASVGVNTVSRYEQGADVRHSSVIAIQRALEAEGASFISDAAASLGGGPGVRIVTNGEG